MVGRYSPGNASVQHEINMHVLPDNGEASHSEILKEYRDDDGITVGGRDRRGERSGGEIGGEIGENRIRDIYGAAKLNQL